MLRNIRSWFRFTLQTNAGTLNVEAAARRLSLDASNRDCCITNTYFASGIISYSQLTLPLNKPQLQKYFPNYAYDLSNFMAVPCS
eukprot:2309080-Amphidinium_carterae.1